MIRRILAAFLIGFATGGGIAAYCGHYGRNRAVAWRTDGSQEGAA